MTDKEKELYKVAEPIREWVKSDMQRNAIVILTEPRSVLHYVFVPNAKSVNLVADMGSIVGMEPQLKDIFHKIIDLADDMVPLQEAEPNTDEHIDYTAKADARPDVITY